MDRTRFSYCLTLLVIASAVLLACLPVGLTTVFAEETSKVTKVSAFAPVKVVEAELKYFVDKMAKDLDDKEEFGEDQQERLELDSATVSVLALTLGMHDEKTEFKPAAGTIVELATEISENYDDFDAAVTAHAKLKQALSEKPKSEPLSWDDPVAEIGALMRQVPIVNGGIRRGVSDKRRFKRTAKRTAQKVVTLAAIAHVSMMNTDYCSDDDDEKEWKKICVDMRDACTEVYKALMANDQKKAEAGNARVVETCDACHERFRD